MGYHQLDCWSLEPNVERVHDRDALALIADDIHYPLGLLSQVAPGKYSIFNLGLRKKNQSNKFIN